MIGFLLDATYLLPLTLAVLALALWVLAWRARARHALRRSSSGSLAGRASSRASS